MLDNSEAWQVNIEDTYKLQQREMQMVRWMCSISLSERRPSEEMRGRLRIYFCGHAAYASQMVWPHRKDGK